MTDADLLRALGRLEGRLEGIERGIGSNRDATLKLADRVDGLTERVAQLERARAWLAGVAAAVSATVTLTGSWLFRHLFQIPPS